MKRYSAFDPPEYVGWTPDVAVMEEFATTLARRSDRAARLRDLPAATLLALYGGMVRFRLHDIALKRWVRQGVISKAWLGTGEEAVTVGNVQALQPGDLVGPMIRNAGACHEMGMPLADLFRAYLGTADQITRGRDLHTGDPARGVVPPISFVASLVPVMTGMALASKLGKTKRVALTWVGDGASRTGEFHEGFNFAAVRRLPLVVVLQDNAIALGTPRSVHSKAPMSGLAKAYGVRGYSCEGNNVLDVYGATLEAVEACRRGEGPALVLASTFRMGGHATHDEAEGRQLASAEEFTYWGKRDPIGAFETYLEGLPINLDTASPSAAGSPEGNRQALARLEERFIEEVDAAATEALASRAERMPDPESLEEDVLARAGSGPEEPAFSPGPVTATGATVEH